MIQHKAVTSFKFSTKYITCLRKKEQNYALCMNATNMKSIVKLYRT